MDNARNDGPRALAAFTRDVIEAGRRDAHLNRHRCEPRYPHELAECRQRLAELDAAEARARIFEPGLFDEPTPPDVVSDEGRGLLEAVDDLLHELDRLGLPERERDGEPLNQALDVLRFELETASRAAGLLRPGEVLELSDVPRDLEPAEVAS